MNLLLIFDLIFCSKLQYKLTSKFHTSVIQLHPYYKVLKTIINTLKTSISFPPGPSWSSYTCAVCITRNLRQRWHSSGGSGLVETRQTSSAWTHVAQRVCTCDFASFVLARTGTLFLRRRLSKSLNHVHRCMWFKEVLTPTRSNYVFVCGHCAFVSFHSFLCRALGHPGEFTSSPVSVKVARTSQNLQSLANK